MKDKIMKQEEELKRRESGEGKTIEKEKDEKEKMNKKR